MLTTTTTNPFSEVWSFSMNAIELEIKTHGGQPLMNFASIDLSTDPTTLNHIPTCVLAFPVRYVDISHHPELRLERKDLDLLLASRWSSSLVRMIVDLAVVERSQADLEDADVSLHDAYASILSRVGVCVCSETELARAEELGFEIAKIFLPASSNNTCIPDWVVQQLRRNQQAIVSLHLRENAIGFEGVQMLADLYRNHQPSSCSLQSLDIGDTNLTDVGTQIITTVLCKACPNLTTLTLDLNGITDTGAADIAEAIRTVHSLKYISLFGNRITSKGTKLIAEAIAAPGQSVVFLNLDENEIEDEGAFALAKSLQSECCMLSTLVLEDTEIGDAGASAIASSLARNMRLTTLFLSRNEIGDEGARSLAETLRDANTTLRTLDLRLTNIGDDGIHEMIEMLKTNRTLDDLRLDHHALPSPLRKVAISASNDCISGVHQRSYSSLARCVRNIFMEVRTVSIPTNELKEAEE